AAGMHALEALKARLALGVDLARIECLALLLVANDLVGGIQLGETGCRLGIVFVRVGMQFLGKLAEGGLDRSLVRPPLHPQNLIGVAHSFQTPSNMASAPAGPEQFRHNVGGVEPLRNAGGSVRTSSRGGACALPTYPDASGRLRPAARPRNPAERSLPGNRGRQIRPACRRWRAG